MVSRLRPSLRGLDLSLDRKLPFNQVLPSALNASNTSLSECSVVGSYSKPATPIFIPSSTRSFRFSKWRRLWATLVLVGEGLAAYMIYFEPKSKKSIQRADFHAHQCQIHCLAGPTVINSEFSSTLDLERDGKELVENEVIEGSDLLAATGTKSHSCPKKSGGKYGQTKVSQFYAIQVKSGRHRDGSIDPNSFIVVDFLQGKVYRFRPLVSIYEQSTTPFATQRRNLKHDSFRSTPSSSPLVSWFRRGFLHSPRARGQNVAHVDSFSHLTAITRARGLSSPGIFTFPPMFQSSDSSTILPISRPQLPAKTSLETLSDKQRDSVDEYGNPTVVQWVCAIQAVLRVVQTTKRN